MLIIHLILNRVANFNDNKPHPGVPNQSSTQYFTLTYLQLVKYRVYIWNEHFNGE